MDLDIKSEVVDDLAWEEELFVDVSSEDEEEPVICSLCIRLYHEAAQGRRFSVRLMDKQLWCPHHIVIVDGAPAAEKKVSMKNEDTKKRKRTQGKSSTRRNKRRRGQQASSSSMNDGQPPTSTVENVNEPEGEEPLSINANMDGVDGQQNVILEEHVETECKDYLLKSANCTTLTNFLSSVIVAKNE